MINADILRAKNKHMPCKLVKLNKYKHKKSTWITQGLLKSIRYRDKLYKQLRLSNPNSLGLHYDTLKFNLTTFQGCVLSAIGPSVYYNFIYKRITITFLTMMKVNTMNRFLKLSSGVKFTSSC